MEQGDNGLREVKDVDRESGRGTVAGRRGTRREDLIAQKQADIHEAVVDALVEKRRDAGLNGLMGNSALGRVAMSMSVSLADIETPEYDQIAADYRQLAKATGYQGTEIGVAYFRKTWPIDTSNEIIANEIIDYFLQTCTTDLWEDWGFGLSRGYVEGSTSLFGMCVVLGTGWADGNALVTNYINKERVKRGAEPLKVNYALRRLARQYLDMDSEPDQRQILADILQVGYAVEGSQVWFDYGGVYAPLPMDGDKDVLTIREVARLVADQYLRDRKSLMNPDWQDVGFVLRREPVLPRNVHPSIPSMMSEFVVARYVHPAVGGYTRYMIRTPHRPDPRMERAGRRRWWWPF